MRLSKLIFLFLLLPVVALGRGDYYKGASTVEAVSNGVIGNSSLAGLSAHSMSAGYWYHGDYVTTTPGSVSYGHVYITNNGATRTICVGLTSSDGTLRLSGSQEISFSGTQWVNIAMGSSYEILDSTTYYLTVQTSVSLSGILNYQASGGNGIFYDNISSYNCSAGLNPEETQIDADGKHVILFNNLSGDPS